MRYFMYDDRRRNVVNFSTVLVFVVRTEFKVLLSCPFKDENYPELYLNTQSVIIIIIIIIIISNLSNDRSKASSKTIPPHSAI
jgi:hypothetical protein